MSGPVSTSLSILSVFSVLSVTTKALSRETRTGDLRVSVEPRHETTPPRFRSVGVDPKSSTRRRMKVYNTEKVRRFGPPLGQTRHLSDVRWRERADVTGTRFKWGCTLPPRARPLTPKESRRKQGETGYVPSLHRCRLLLLRRSEAVKGLTPSHDLPPGTSYVVEEGLQTHKDGTGWETSRVNETEISLTGGGP